MSSHVLPRFLPKTHSGAVGVDFGDVRNFAKKPQSLRANSHDGSQKGLKVFEIFKACRRFDERRGGGSGNNDPRDTLSRRERDVHPRETSRSSVVAI
jgi:hypothetical protein